jgi:hypothetical protein
MARPLLAALVLVATPVLASSKGDWFASLYTGEGVELRNDERIFALFAIFNALGFDEGPVTRKDPVPRVVYHPVRQQVRARVISGDPEVRKAAEAFFDAHPVALRRYLAYVANSEPPPFSSGAKAKDLQDLKGLEQLLAKAWTGWKLEELAGTVQGEYRKTLKGYLQGLDAPLGRARVALRVPEATEVAVVVNLLDAHDQVRAVATESNEVLVVVGPSDKPNLQGVLREFARLFVEPAVGRQVSKWAGGVPVLKEAQLAGATEQSLAELATSVISQAIALRALEAPDAAWEAAAARGYFGIRDVARLFDEGKPLDTVVVEAMQKIETRRPAKK